VNEKGTPPVVPGVFARREDAEAAIASTISR
jgi:hypothetical protein